MEAPVTAMPVFIRAGAVIPKSSKAMQPADEIHIYGGADGSFELYEDSGTDYSYENGAYSLIELKWEEKSHKFTAKAEKTACGYPEKLRIMLHTDGNVQEKEMLWDGTEAEVRF